MTSFTLSLYSFDFHSFTVVKKLLLGKVCFVFVSLWLSQLFSSLHQLYGSALVWALRKDQRHTGCFGLKKREMISTNDGCVCVNHCQVVRDEIERPHNVYAYSVGRKKDTTSWAALRWHHTTVHPWWQYFCHFTNWRTLDGVGLSEGPKTRARCFNWWRNIIEADGGPISR